MLHVTRRLATFVFAAAAAIVGNGAHAAPPRGGHGDAVTTGLSGGRSIT